MQTAPIVSFENMPISADLEAVVLDQARKLERFYDRITSCRVVLSGPTPRHRHGGSLGIHVDLEVPGETIVVRRESSLAPASTDPQVTIRDAFHAVRRELQDHVRRARGSVKFHGEEPPSSEPASFASEVEIPAGKMRLPGDLAIPARAHGLVLFAHGSGSSRASPRNVHVAAELRSRGFGTLLFDLLTEEEAADRYNVFDVRLLAKRLAAATVWVRGRSEARGLPIGYFGASTGAAAALVAAADDADVRAIVSRGGRPDLAEDILPFVAAPTLLVVGEKDAAVQKLNREGFLFLRGLKELAIVPGAGHLFEEPGAIEEVVRLATGWFQRHLAAGAG